MEEQMRPPAPTRRVGSGLWTALLSAGLLLYSLAIWLDWPPPAGTRYVPPPGGAGETPAHWWDKAQALRGWSVYREGWAWALLAPAPLERWLAFAGLGLLGAAALWWGTSDGPRRTGRVPMGTLVALVGLGVLLQLGALWLKNPHPAQLLFDRITNRAFTGYFTSATTVRDPAFFFGGYADALAVSDASRLCGHCRSHPPGAILFYWVPLQAVRALPAETQQRLAAHLSWALQIAPGTQPPAETIVAIGAAYVLLLGGR
jgi:hypothetical protein